MTRSRDELADLILCVVAYEGREGETVTAEDRDSHEYLNCQKAAEAILSAGYRKITLDNATVTRAARDAWRHVVTFPGGGRRTCEVCGELPDALSSAAHQARAVLAAAVKEEL